MCGKWETITRVYGQEGTLVSIGTTTRVYLVFVFDPGYRSRGSWRGTGHIVLEELGAVLDTSTQAVVLEEVDAVTSIQAIVLEDLDAVLVTSTQAIVLEDLDAVLDTSTQAIFLEEVGSVTKVTDIPITDTIFDRVWLFIRDIIRYVICLYYDTKD